MRANAATMLGTRAGLPSGGIGQSKASSPAVRVSMSSFMRSHAWSCARMSIDSVFATAPSPRGCSAPFTQTSNGCGVPSSTWPTKIAKVPKGDSTM